ncbi:hypothetical protein BDZ85DRAFT_322755 [Elsinoe ampelina]|uniref:Myb-like domain-containing protein n=1 Tax=Elsinoe ampelina TaxID=302913 RepID=A0A6A6FZP7_9PEZI|nr:hypothetical protein BDZ85DRAFT_322755 [Elsinoe ampelina]
MTLTFTEREMELLKNGMLCANGRIDIDMEKFAVMSGLPPASARASWNKLLRKITAKKDTRYTQESSEGKKAAANTPATPKSGKKGGRGKKAKRDEDAEDGAQEDESPSPKRTKVEVEEEADDAVVKGEPEE